MTADLRDIRIVSMNENLSGIADINSRAAPARIVFFLSDSPSEEWVERFNNDFNISEHLTGGAKIFVTSNRVEAYCDPEQFESVLLPTIKKVIFKANAACRELLEKQRKDMEEKRVKEIAIKAKLAELKNKLKFD